MLLYTKEELEILKSKDKKLSAVIDEAGFLECHIKKDYFLVFIRSIITQQISIKAGEAIFSRFKNYFDNEITPEKVAKTDDEIIRSLGLSFRKVGYIKGFAEMILNKDFVFEDVQKMDDDLAIKELSKIKGVGSWTAEMMLIFTFGRKNILSFKDLTIIKALSVIYKHKKITKELFEKYKKLYSPYNSIASLYLWYVAENNIDKNRLNEIINIGG